MKIRNGKIVRLDENERRIGNFVIRCEADYVKLFDINRVFIYSARREVPVGMFLSQCYDDLKDEKTGKGLANYVAVLWSMLSVVPDMQFLSEVYKASEDCMKRHPEAYGMPKNAPTKKDDAEALRSVEELRQFEDEVKAAVAEDAKKKRKSRKKKKSDEE